MLKLVFSLFNIETRKANDREQSVFFVQHAHRHPYREASSNPLPVRARLPPELSPERQRFRVPTVHQEVVGIDDQIGIEE